MSWNFGRYDSNLKFNFSPPHLADNNVGKAQRNLWIESRGRVVFLSFSLLSSAINLRELKKVLRAQSRFKHPFFTAKSKYPGKQSSFSGIA
jgi:hypothetical protein